MYCRIGIIISFILILLSSCKKESDCFHSFGSEKSIIIKLGDFNTFTLDGNNLTVNLINDSINYLEINGGENSINFIDYKLENKNLFISNDNKCNWLRSSKNNIQIDLHFKDLEDISNLGDGSIKSSNKLEIDTISIHQNGTGNISIILKSDRIWTDLYVIGDIELKGETESLIATVGSYGNLKAKKLKADWVSVKTINEGDAHIYPVSGLSAICEQIGDIYYYNKVENPNIVESEQGKVELIIE